MKTIKVVLTAIVFLFFFSGCEEKDNIELISGPEIEWISGGTTTTYTYSGGVISGYYFHRSFSVLKESGEVIINIQILNDDNTKVSGTFNIENGKQYSLKVKGSKSGSQVSSPGSNCLTVVLSSPNSLTNQEIKVGSYLISSGGIDTYYCPTSLIFGEISLSE
ncbi:MAG: hypothetical protein JW702_11615 [Clostridiales bacterium]|nr:hypothetical protein [Clostridiales bacterium]